MGVEKTRLAESQTPTRSADRESRKGTCPTKTCHPSLSKCVQGKLWSYVGQTS